jgi:hypothetical protein
MFQNISDAVRNEPLSTNSPIYIVDGSVWQNLLGTFRYLGGTPGFSDTNGFPADQNIRNFMLSTSNGKGVYNINKYITESTESDISYTDAQLVDFMPRAWENIRELGTQVSGISDRNAVPVGMREIRDFIAARFPILATILQNIATDYINGDEGTQYGASKKLADASANLIANYIGGYENVITDLNEIGILNSDMQYDDALDAIQNVFDPINPNINFALPYGFNEANLRNSIRDDKTFGVCPHVAFKIGYFVKEANCNLYAKLGAIMLNGAITTSNQLYNISSEKFRKFSPLLAIGVNKLVNKKWGITLELSHAFKTTKKLRDITPLAHRISNYAIISANCIKLIVTYNFNN